MTQTWLEHVQIMKEANNRLRLISSSKCLEEGKLTKALADAENEGVDMYIEESDRKKNASTTPSTIKPHVTIQDLIVLIMVLKVVQ